MRVLFAIDLPAEAQGAIAAACDSWRLDASAWRRVRTEDLHLTLRFIGEVEDTAVPGLTSIGRRAASASSRFACELSSAGAFASRRRARVLWVGILDRSKTRELSGLAARLEEGLRGEGYPAEKRPFSPHVTVARVRGGAATRLSVPPAFEAALRFEVAALTLFRSHTGPGGSRYEPLAVLPLS